MTKFSCENTAGHCNLNELVCVKCVLRKETHLLCIKLIIPAMSSLNMNMHMWIASKYAQCISRCKTLLIVCLRLRHVASARVFPVHLESAWFCIPLCQWCAIRPAHARTGRRPVPLPTDTAVNFWTCEERGLPQPLGLRERHTERERQEECGKWCPRQCYILSSDVL